MLTQLTIFILTIVFLYLPISLPLSSIGTKPIDIVFSDLLILVTVFLLILDSIKGKKLQISYVFKISMILISINMVYILLSMLYSFAYNSSFISILSAVKLYKMLLLFIVGYYFSIRYKFDYYKYSIYIISIIVIIIFYGTITDNHFPLIRWGSSFLNYPVYGFPNNGMTFFAFLLFFLLTAFIRYKKIVYLLFYILGFLIVIFSLSRSSILVLIIGSFLILFKSKNTKKLIILLSFISLLVISFGYHIKNNENAEKLINLVEYRIDRTLGNTKDDVSSGRFDIWNKTLKIIDKKPLFGYSFEPFSNQNVDGVDTPHNQYLELIYKVGLIGLILLFCFIIYISTYIYKNQYIGNTAILKNIYMYGLLSVLVGSITQPNLSFAPLGNLIFFIAGYLIAKKSSNIIRK